MKNSYIKLFFWLFSIVIITACNDDALERFPLDKVSNETFWNTTDDLEIFNNGIYDLAKNDTDYWIMMGYGIGGKPAVSSPMIDQMTDNYGTVSNTANFYVRIRAGQHTVPNSVQWGGWHWELLRNVNTILENYQKVDAIPSELNKYVGEARLFRAWFYFDKTKKFGDTPWINKPLNIDSPELNAGRDSREVVMDSVLADINFAIQHLPENWGGDPGRLNKWCALTLKSRICLFEGTFRKYHGGTNPDAWLLEAEKAAKEVMISGQYSLYNTGNINSDYNYIFRQQDLSGNSEVIYWRKYEHGVMTNGIQSGSQQIMGGASKDMMEDYLCTDGLPITQSSLYQGDLHLEDVFVNRDPRLRQSILHPEDKEPIGFGWPIDDTKYPVFPGYPGLYTTSTGYHIRKFYTAADNVPVTNLGITAAVVLRYGEVLLNYAEAKAELGTLTQNDLDISINLLRERVGMPAMDIGNIIVDDKYADEGVSSLIVEIRRERRVELFGEGHRIWDIYRWKQGRKLKKPTLGMRWEAPQMERWPLAKVTAITDPVSGNDYIQVHVGDFATPVFDENKHYFWPIPNEVRAQNPKIGQNPGWGE